MLFKNKTNSKILENLQIEERILKFKYMRSQGSGLELLEALHSVVSPEEIFEHYKAFGMTKNQVNRLKIWLKHNCDINLTTKEVGFGYGFIMRSLGDNGKNGVLTKIRRNLTDWEPTITPEGKLHFNDYDWLKTPKIIFKNSEMILVKREYDNITYKPKIFGTGKDTFYEKQLIGFVKVDNVWRKATHGERKEIINALEVMKVLVS